MLSNFTSQGVPVDGVGLQMHISVDAYPSAKDISTNIARLVALGLEVHVTEMDVRCVLPCGADRLALQAQIYGDILQACLDNSKPTNSNGKGGCKSFEFWGFTDLHTWLYDFNNPTHENEQPLPWDIKYNPKPAFYQLLAVLQAQ
jgi:endo-1,4-beta-xylanase